MEALFIVILILCVLTIVFFLLEYYIFIIAFKGTNKKETDYHDTIKAGSSYSKYSEAVGKAADRIRSMSYEKVYIRSYDGLKLYGRIFRNPANKGTAALFHGFRANGPRDFGMMFDDIYNKGFNILIIDQRAHGGSEGKAITYGIKESRDCIDWIKYINTIFGNDLPVILHGISMGAATVLMASGYDDIPSNVKGIIADCGYTTVEGELKNFMKISKISPRLMPFLKLSAKMYAHFDICTNSPIGSMKKCHVPILFIHGNIDHLVPCDMSKLNYESCIAPKQLVLIDGADHALSYITDPAKYENSCNSFLKTICNL